MKALIFWNYFKHRDFYGIDIFKKYQDGLEIILVSFFTYRGGNIMQLQPRLIRLRDAPYYLGMDKNRFNEEVRPYLIPIPTGIHGIGFDILDLDAWVDHYKACSGRPAERGEIWDEEYAKVLEQKASKKLKNF
jgi:hypothetical protein